MCPKKKHLLLSIWNEIFGGKAGAKYFSIADASVRGLAGAFLRQRKLITCVFLILYLGSIVFSDSLWNYILHQSCSTEQCIQCSRLSWYESHAQPVLFLALNQLIILSQRTLKSSPPQTQAFPVRVPAFSQRKRRGNPFRWLPYYALRRSDVFRRHWITD